MGSPEHLTRPSRDGWAALVVTGAARTALALVLGLTLWSVVPSAFGWHPTVVASASMMPRLHVGDVVISRPVGTADLHVGQVLLVDDPDHPGRLRLHRLVAFRPDGRLTLRGDANPTPDSGAVSVAAVIGVGALRVPWIGSVYLWARDGAWLRLASAGAALIVLILLAFWYRPPGRRPLPGPRPLPYRPTAGTWRSQVTSLSVLSAGLALLVGVGAASPAGGAAFSGTTANPADSWHADALQPPGSFAVYQTCSGGTPTARLSWTATPSTYAAGYQLARAGVTTRTITPYTTTTTTDGPLANNSSFTWQLDSYAGNWASPSVSASLTTNCPPPSIGAPNPTSGGVGTSVTISGTGFTSSAPITVTFGATAATITSGGTASANGDVNVTFTVPFSGNGTYAITVSDGTTTLTSATRFTVTGSFDGIMYTGITLSGGTQNCSTAAIGQSTTCAASGLGGTGTFTGSVTFVTSARAAISNAGASLTVTSAETTVSAPGGTVTPASATIGTGASTTGSAFTLLGGGRGWQATMACSVTVNGVTYTVAVTGS